MGSGALPALLALGLLLQDLPPTAGEPPVELGPVTVPLPEEPAPEAPTQRAPTASVTTVDVASARAEGATLGELLERAPGLRVHGSGGTGQAQSLTLRGASASGVRVLLDGVPMGLGGAAVDLSLLPLSLLDRVEVLRGAAGAAYGAGAMGGVLHLSSVRPQASPRLFTRLGAGSFGRARAELGATAAVGPGEALLLLHGERSQGDFPYLFDPSPTNPLDGLEPRVRANNDARRLGVLGRYRQPWGEGGRVDLWGEVHRHQRGLAGTQDNPTPDAREEGDREVGALRLSRRLGPAEWGLRLHGRRERLDLRGGYFGPGHAQTEQSLGAEASVRAVLRERHALFAALEAGREALGVAGPEDPSRTLWAVALSDEWLLAGDRVTLVPALRFERVGPYALFSRRLGAQAELGGGVALRGNVGQGARAPSFLELEVPQGALLPNPDLRPERSLGADLGVGARDGGRRVEGWLTAFGALYEDLISYEYYPPLLSRPYNFGAARAWGLELEGRLSPRPWLLFESAYTFLRTRNTKDLAGAYGKELPYRPRHALWSRLSVGPTWLRGFGEVRAQSRQFRNRTEQLWLEARAFVDAGLSSELPFWRGAQLHAELTNLFDVHSADLAGYPLPGRAVQLSFALTLERSPSTRSLEETPTP